MAIYQEQDVSTEQQIQRAYSDALIGLGVAAEQWYREAKGEDGKVPECVARSLRLAVDKYLRAKEAWLGPVLRRGA
jgi:hypothetical protein